MFRSFTVKNFRCFRDLTVEPLARVNLIAGKNNVGKTALLEALFLHAGASNPLVSININTFRGMELSSTDVRDLWGWLFYGKRMEETIELTSIDVNGLRRQLHVTLAAPTMTVITPPTSGQAGVRDGDSLAERRSALSTAVLASKELMMHYEDSGGRASL